MQYPKYEKYKDSGFEWLGIIPAHWETNRLKGMSTLFGRIGYRGYSTEDIVDFEEGAITVSPSNMQNGKFDFSKNTYITWAKYNESPEIKLSQGDIVMVKTGSTIGKVSYAETISYPSTINPQLMIFKRIKCIKKYLFYFLFSDNIQSIIPLMNTGSTIPTMTQDGIGKLPLLLPPFQEQQSIADFLDRETLRIDSLIEKKQKLIGTLKRKRTAIISNAVTKGLIPNVQFRPSGFEWLDEIPSHWKTIKLKWISNIYAGGTPDKSNEDFWDNGTIPWINSGAVNQRLIDCPSEYITLDAFNRSSAKWIAKGSLVMALAGQGKTKGMVAQLAIKTTCNQSMAAICPIDSINSRYILYWLDLNYQNIRNLAGGDQRDGLNLSIIGDIKCPVPPKSEQSEIADFIDGQYDIYERLINKTLKTIIKLQEYKTTLISAAVSGKIKV